MIGLIIADLRRYWVGALMTVALIAMAVALGTAIQLQERSLRLGSARAAEKFDLLIGAPGSEAQLVLSAVFLQPAALPLLGGDVLADLQHDDRVVWAEPIATGDFYKGFPIIGTTARLVTELAPEFTEGVVFSALDEAVVGAAVDLDVGRTFAPMHGQVEHSEAQHDDVEYRIAGRLSPTGTPWDRAILVPIRSSWKVHGLVQDEDRDSEHDHDETHASGDLDETFVQGQTPDIPAILVKPASIAAAYKLRQDYRANEKTVAVFPAEVLTSLYGLLGDVTAVLSYVALAARILVGVSLIMLAVIHVLQRRHTLSALRALGAPRWSLFALVWGQAIVISICGVVLGQIGGLAAASLISSHIENGQGFSLPVEFASTDLTGTIALLVAAAVFAALPALIAFRQPAATGLRGGG